MKQNWAAMNRLLRRYWPLTLLGLALLLTGGSYGAMAYTNQPGFCSSCHVMHPYVASWKSSHHDKVACVDCHYAPGEKYKISAKMHALNQVVAYWTGTYDTKFYAVVKDASCTQCHPPEKISQAGLYNGKVKFNHTQHYGQKVDGMQLKCTSCHNHTEAKSHFGVDTGACFLCHFKEEVNGSKPLPQSFCLNCHEAPKEDIDVAGTAYSHTDFVARGVDCQRCHLDAIEGHGQVEKNVCLQCHDESRTLAEYGLQPRLHEIHVTENKVDCYRCHASINHGAHPGPTASPAEAEEIRFTCEQCHAKTHLGPREMYAGTGGRNVEDSPSRMYQAQVDCIGCHLDEHTSGAETVMTGSVMRPSVKGCVDCHDDTGREFYEMWTQQLAEAQAEATVVVTKAASVVDLASGKGDAGKLAEARQKLDDAQYNLNFVRYGRGVHNVSYALSLLEQAKADAEAAAALVEK